MLKQLICCCAGVALLAGCGVTSQNGKWHKMEHNEFMASSALSQLNFAESFCSTEAPSKPVDDCINKQVEPRRYRLEMEKENTVKERLAAEATESSSPFNSPSAATPEVMPDQPVAPKVVVTSLITPRADTLLTTVALEF